MSVTGLSVRIVVQEPSWSGKNLFGTIDHGSTRSLVVVKLSESIRVRGIEGDLLLLRMTDSTSFHRLEQHYAIFANATILRAEREETDIQFPVTVVVD
jgi:hypothetical protein